VPEVGAHQTRESRWFAEQAQTLGGYDVEDLGRIHCNA